MADETSGDRLGTPGEPVPTDGDVTLRKLANALLVDPAAPLVTVDEFGTIRHCTAAVEDLTGYGIEDIIGSSVFDFLDEDEASTAATLFIRRLEYQGPDLGRDVILRHADGSPVPVNVTASVLPEQDLGVAALTLHRHSSEDPVGVDLRRRLVIEQFCNRLSGSFMQADDWGASIDRLEHSLGELAMLGGADSASVFVERPERGQLTRLALWSDPFVDDADAFDHIALDDDRTAIESLLTETMSTNDILDELGEQSALARRTRARAVLTCPFSIGTQRAMLVLAQHGEVRPWTDADGVMVARAAALYGRALRQARAEQLLALTYQRGRIGFSIRTADGVLVDCNDRYRELLGLPSDNLRSSGLSERVHPHERADVMTTHQLVAQGVVDEVNREVRVLAGDVWRWVRIHAVRLETPGSTEPFVLTSLEDIHELREQRIALEYAASHDALTGVPNRSTMESTIEEFERGHGRLPNLLVIDIDRFKRSNDSLGHHVGDQILKAVAARIVSQVRDADLVARIGGDEFAVVVPDLNPEHAAGLADRLRRAMEEPLAVGDRLIHQTVSIGVALGEDSDSIAGMLVQADRAMYSAKSNGRNRHAVFDRSMRDEDAASLALERELREALDSDQLEMYFQPEFSVDDRRIIGAEALIRWHHPERGVVTAEHFIEVAERSGMIDEIGRFALRRSCASFADIVRQVGCADLKLRINISAREWQRRELPELVRTAVADADLHAACLCLEITETTLMDTAENVLEAFDRLQQIGVEFAIDDFGTGYSSLTYLKRFPVDVLKIDRSFIEDVHTNADSRAIVESIMGLSRTLGLDVVAEGVETEEQLRTVEAFGCRRAQGWLVAGALHPHDFADLVRSR